MIEARKLRENSNIHCDACNEFAFITITIRGMILFLCNGCSIKTEQAIHEARI